MRFDQVHSAYFLGIGGIGMSALARYFALQGIAVAGYDRTSTELTRSLEKEGIPVHYEEDIEQLPERIDLVVYTPAVPADQAELVHLRQQDVPILKRAEVLGMISQDKRCIAVAGTHGKTTTSTILTWLLWQGKVSCTAFLGGIADDFQSNFVAGETDWVVAEADEFDRSFLQLSPEIAIILSIEPDHLDIYGDEEQIVETGFRAFARRLKPGGTLWINERVKDALAHEGPTHTFGLDAGQVRAESVRVENGVFQFDLHHPGGIMKGLRLSLPGRHNVENAVAALAVALQLGVSEDDARKALSRFRGIKRRFERLYDSGDQVYIDDYAHHPSELMAAIGAARELFPGRKITGVFQPHLYSRTRDFAEGFARALDQLDEVILMDIYPAREKPIPGVSSDMLAGLMEKPAIRAGKDNLMEILRTKDIDVLLTLGAGDIDLFRQPIREWLEAGASPIKKTRI